MDIVVCGKIIPASSVTIEIDPGTKRMIRKGVTHELDPAAASAVEEALRLIEKVDGTVTLVTMGFNEINIGVRTALAMGATSAVHIFDDALAGSDTLSTAKAWQQPFASSPLISSFAAPRAATATRASFQANWHDSLVFHRLHSPMS